MLAVSPAWEKRDTGTGAASLHLSWEVCLSAVSSLPVAIQCKAAGSERLKNLQNDFPGLEEIHMSSFIHHVHLQKEEISLLSCAAVLPSGMHSQTVNIYLND